MSIFNLSSHAADTLFGVANLLGILGAVLVLTATILAVWTSGLRDRYADLRISSNEAETADAKKDAARANEAATKARLELARIDPANLPIKSIRADVYLLIRGNFNEKMYLEASGATPPMLFDFRIIDKSKNILQEIPCSQVQVIAMNAGSLDEKSHGKSFSLTFIWPANDWLNATSSYKFWIEKDNVSMAILAKKMAGAFTLIPAVLGTADITAGTCVVTFNGSIQRRFSIAPTVDAGGIVAFTPQPLQ